MLQDLDDRVDCVSIIKNLGRLKSDIVNAENMGASRLVHGYLVLGYLSKPTSRGGINGNIFEDLASFSRRSSVDRIQILAHRDKGIHRCGLAVAAVSAEQDAALGRLGCHYLRDGLQIVKDVSGRFAFHASCLHFLAICKT